MKFPALRAFGASLCLLVALVGLSPARANILPTGVFNSSADQTIRAKMVATNSVWLPYLKFCADNGTGIENNGTAAAYYYLYTGNKSYAVQAWSQMKPFAVAGTLPSGNNGNSIRIWFGLYCLCYPYLKPTLSVSDQQLYQAWMAGVAAKARVGFFSGNANGLIGEYLGLCLYSILFNDPSVLQGTWKDSGVVKPYGGLDYDPTLSARGSARNAIHDYIVTSYPPGSQTGVWLEGTQYINASMFNLLLLTDAINQLTGKDHFPELTQALPQIGLSVIGLLTNDFKDEWRFGDNEFADLHPSDFIPTLVLLQRRLQGTTVGSYVQWVINYLASSSGLNLGYSGYSCRMYLRINPYAPATDFRNHQWSVNGAWQSVWRSGWNASDSFFGVGTDGLGHVNHSWPDEVFRSFRLWRDGVWVIDHPWSYGGLGVYPDGNNTVVAGGKGDMENVAQTAVEDGVNYLYSRSETSGPPYPLPMYKPPQPYLNEQTGSVLYVHGRNASCDVIVTADRVNATNPLAATNPAWPTGWRSWDAGRINDAESWIFPADPLQWTLHMQEQPQVGNGQIAWDVGEQHVVSTELSPNPLTTDAVLIDETEKDASGNYVFFNYGSVAPQVRKWQVRESWTDGEDWHFLLHAITVYDGATAPSVSRVSGNGVMAALVCPANEAATLAVFGNNESGRLIESGFTLTFSVSGLETDVYIPDLDPAKTWSLVKDGAPAVPVTFGPGGVARSAFYGKGQHTLTLVCQ